MSWASLCARAVVGILVTGFAATASKALQGFSRRELEVYSRRRQRTDRATEGMAVSQQRAYELITGQQVRVQTCVHPELDLVAVRIESTQIERGEFFWIV